MKYWFAMASCILAACSAPADAGCGIDIQVEDDVPNEFRIATTQAARRWTLSTGCMVRVVDESNRKVRSEPVVHDWDTGKPVCGQAAVVWEPGTGKIHGMSWIAVTTRTDIIRCGTPLQTMMHELGHGLGYMEEGPEDTVMGEYSHWLPEDPWPNEHEIDTVCRALGCPP